nr:MAG TPA: hypothetical protein [Caudoviricetes sp.]
MLLKFSVYSLSKRVSVYLLYLFGASEASV